MTLIEAIQNREFDSIICQVLTENVKLHDKGLKLTRDSTPEEKENGLDIADCFVVQPGIKRMRIEELIKKENNLGRSEEIM